MPAANSHPYILIHAQYFASLRHRSPLPPLPFLSTTLFSTASLGCVFLTSLILLLLAARGGVGEEKKNWTLKKTADVLCRTYLGPEGYA